MKSVHCATGIKLLSTATVILVHTSHLSDNWILSSYKNTLYNSIPAGALHLEQSYKPTGKECYGMATRQYDAATLQNTLNSLLVHVKLFYS